MMTSNIVFNLRIISASFNQTLYKKIKDLPPHKHLKLEGLFYFLSALW
jgi:hypothetical protein